MMVAMKLYLHLTRTVLVIVSFSVCLTGAVECGNRTFLDDNLCRPCGFCLGETNGSTEACDPKTGACSHGCIQGYIEPLCLHKCGACIGGNDQCNNGVCGIGCEQGFTGESCNIPCTAGTYGENCEHVCGHCEGGNTTCNIEVGACKEGCEDGWSGLFCNIQCPNGRWGPNCDKKCGNCDRMDSCNKATGECKGQCKKGWRSFDCTEPCPRGYHGKNCLSKCQNCKKGCTCDPVTGVCETVCRKPAFDNMGSVDDKTAFAASAIMWSDVKPHEKTVTARMLESPALIISILALVLAVGALIGVFIAKKRR